MKTIEEVIAEMPQAKVYSVLDATLEYNTIQYKKLYFDSNLR